MLHAAIDLGGKESQICIRDASGTIVEEKRCWTRSLPSLIATWKPSRVVMETSSEAFRIADAAIAAGHEVRVVPATLVRQLGVADRGVKNDRRDAQTLSRVSWQTDLPTVHIPSDRSRMIKSLCGSRDTLVQARTALVNNVRGWVRGQLWKLKGCKPGTLSMHLRALATSLDKELPEHIERQLRALDAIHEQVKGADRQVATLAAEDPICRRLMDVPGVGPVTALRFVATIDNPHRFPTAHRLQSYLGLTPGENSSSERERKTGITKAGPSALRRCLISAAWAAMKTKSEPRMVSWAKAIAERRSRYVAVAALARKLAGILFAIWRDGTTYDPKRTAAPTPSTTGQLMP